mmetsp:Transcript_9199/g.30663  ORF Transcript_9199/g.30663 Transcript_9199/m.30663 type:complete len:88 (+) Transcript_9199:346-609(+)
MTNVPSETWSPEEGLANAVSGKSQKLVEQSKESVKFLPATTGSGETFTLLTDRLVAPPPQSDQELGATALELDNLPRLIGIAPVRYR